MTGDASVSEPVGGGRSLWAWVADRQVTRSGLFAGQLVGPPVFASLVADR
jgi:hypothetical protein